MGFWLLLQNCHLSLSFCEEIMQTVIDSEEIHANFRFVIRYLGTFIFLNVYTTNKNRIYFHKSLQLLGYG